MKLARQQDKFKFFSMKSLKKLDWINLNNES
jgi:hypothetical protein